MSQDARFRMPFDYPYREEVITNFGREAICFAEWLAPNSIIFGNRSGLMIRDTFHNSSYANPLEGCGNPNRANCMHCNPSKTRLAVGYKESVIVYELPALYSDISNKADIDYVCWLNDYTLATVSSKGKLIIRTWKTNIYKLWPRAILLPDYESPSLHTFNYHCFDYHVVHEEFLYLSQTSRTLYVISADLTQIRSRSFEYPLYQFDVPIPAMIAVHSSCPLYFVTTYTSITVLNPITLENVYIINCSNFVVSMSVAGNVITYSVGSHPRSVKFFDIETAEMSRYSLISQVEVEDSRVVPGKDFISIPRKPLISKHAYNSDRTRIFCGGIITGRPPSVGASHASVWRVQTEILTANVSLASPERGDP